MWLYLAFAGYACLALVSILDKSILSKKKINPSVFVFYSTVFLSPLLLLIPFQLFTTTFERLVIIASAAGFCLGMYTMYRAFLQSEISHSGPFIGALTPLFVLVFSQFFLTEEIMPGQLLGIIFLCIGTLVIAFDDKPSHSEWQYGMIWSILSALFFSIFHVAAKFTYLSIGFGSGFVNIWGTIGMFGLCLFFLPTVREAIFPNQNPLKAFFHHFWHMKHSSSPLVIFDKVLSAFGVLLIQFAISLGSVTIVNALAGLQFGILIVLIAILSRYYPKIFKEKYHKDEMKREIFAVGLIALGLIFIVK